MRTTATIMLVLVCGALLLALQQVLVFFFQYPWHAQCTVQWTLTDDCRMAQDRLQAQIEAWSGNACPNVSETCPAMPCGQKCNYKLTESSATEIKATHTTPKHQYVDALTFNFDQADKTCSIKGYSTSLTWYALLDYGTNYCNLRNLVVGAGLADAPGFTETTSDAICTQYTSRDCERY